MALQKRGDSLLFFLDSSAIMNGANFPPAQCRTTPSVLEEFQPGGATWRRLETLKAGGMGLRSPTLGSLAQVEQEAQKAGSRSRLSQTDLDLLACCLDAGAQARLVTDDYTIQDVARRLNVATLSIVTPGIKETRDWKARCTGCGRTYSANQSDIVCKICGSEIRLKPHARKPK